MKASTTTTFPGFDVLRQSETKPPDPHLRKRTGHYQLLATADRHPVFLQLAGEFTIAEQYKIMKKTGPMPCLCYWPLAVQFIHFPDQRIIQLFEKNSPLVFTVADRYKPVVNMGKFDVEHLFKNPDNLFNIALPSIDATDQIQPVNQFGQFADRTRSNAQRRFRPVRHSGPSLWE